MQRDCLRPHLTHYVKLFGRNILQYALKRLVFAYSSPGQSSYSVDDSLPLAPISAGGDCSWSLDKEAEFLEIRHEPIHVSVWFR